MTGPLEHDGRSNDGTFYIVVGQGFGTFISQHLWERIPQQHRLHSNGFPQARGWHEGHTADSGRFSSSCLSIQELGMSVTTGGNEGFESKIRYLFILSNALA